MLTLHQKAVLEVCQENMAKFQTYTDTNSNILPDEYDYLTYDLLPKQFEKMITLQIAALNPTTGPTTLIFLRSDKARDLTWDPKLMALKHDIRVKYGDTNSTGIDIPVADEYLQLVTVCVASKPLPNGPESLVDEIDRQSVRTLQYMSTFGKHILNWENQEFRNMINPFILSNPKNEDVVKSKMPNTPVYLHEDIDENKAVVGYKNGEFDADLAFIPYVPFLKSENGYRTRFGMISNPMQVRCFSVFV